MKWELVVGLETHVELQTKSKIFCSCSTKFGDAPNSHCCPVCIGLPGSLPNLNRRAVELAVMAGLALNCDINRHSVMDRKHYFYPDLPKAFQISQYEHPLCINGYVDISNGRRINIARVHLEEDSGKLIHEKGKVLIDHNRAGIPLIEIVTQPDIRSGAEAAEYLKNLRGILRTAGISDCRMQEGSMRCDVNISVRESGSSHFGTRTEVKNLNSFSSVEAAIEYEFHRQISLIEGGIQILQETLSFDSVKGETSNIRSKENTDDYRFFEEPDLAHICLRETDIDRLRRAIPELPNARKARYINEYGLSEADAALLCEYNRASSFFESAAKGLKKPAVAAAFILTHMFSMISTDEAREHWKSPIPPEYLNSLLIMLETKKINNNLAKTIFLKMLAEGRDAESIIREEGMELAEPLYLDRLCENAIKTNSAAAMDYKNGKTKALQALIGNVMRLSKGRADAEEARNILLEMLCKLD